MGTWDVKVTEKRRATNVVRVEADSWVEAHDRAIKAWKALPPEAMEVSYDSQPLRCHGEPWVKIEDGGFYLDHQSGPPNIIVPERAFGFVFTEREVALLRERIEALGFVVEDQWNGISPATGAGLSTVSFKIGNRVGRTKLTPEQVAAICAPRPEGWENIEKREGAY